LLGDELKIITLAGKGTKSIYLHINGNFSISPALFVSHGNEVVKINREQATA
jgi:hypothetical protein